MKRLIEFKKNTKSINNPLNIFENIKKININHNQENFILFCLNSKNEIITNDIIFMGGLCRCSIDFKTILKKALINNSESIIIAHNHPSGTLKPSDDDKRISIDLKKACDIITIRLLDSIIFNKKEFYSLKEEDLI